eukprot:2898977-Prymnesium_polylepis.1
MMRREAVTGATRALRCRDWLESPCADPSARACVATLVRVSSRRPRGAGRAGAPTRPARAPGRAG